MLEIIRSDDFRDSVTAMGGYDPKESGKVLL